MTLAETIQAVKDSYRERDEFIEGDVLYPQSIIQGQATTVLSGLAADSVDLIVTSPPYFGVVDYVKSQRLTLEWLGEDLESLRENELGARSKRHRKRAAEQFADELSTALARMAGVLKPNAVCAIVYGTSDKRTSVELPAMAEKAGLESLGELARQISVQRSLSPSLKDETLFLFRKPTSH
jgi:DNA modification methylase